MPGVIENRKIPSNWEFVGSVLVFLTSQFQKKHLTGYIFNVLSYTGNLCPQNDTAVPLN